MNANKPGRNEAQYQAAQGLRLSSAAGRHADRRDRRARTRKAQKARAIKEAS